MTKWEYDWVDSSDIDEAGRNGWEAVAVAVKPYKDHDDYQHYDIDVLMKRKIEEPKND